MKKLLPLVSLTILLSLFGCGGNQGTSSSAGDISSPSSSSSSEDSSSASSSKSEDIPYYSSFDWSKTGAELKTALSALISPHTDVGYQGLREAYNSTDADEDGYIVDMYSLEQQYKAEWKGGNYPSEGSGYNREHIIPQSVIGKDTLPYSDLFNVYPTDGYVNNMRGNYPHGQVGEATYTSGNGSKRGPSSFSGYSDTVFEPIDKWKGDIARSYFYTVTCYESSVPNWSAYDSLAKNSYPSLSSWTVELFLQWHDADPVDEWEKGRNERVYAIQKNRNPFIDHPEAAHLIWDSAY